MTSITTDGHVEFRFFRPKAHAVVLAGDFNGWNTDEIAMRRGEPGWWTVRLNLQPGDYRFRYFADGLWYSDFASFGVEPTPGGFFSVLRVPPSRAASAASVECNVDSDEIIHLVA